jgi:hypothetical protein
MRFIGIVALLLCANFAAQADDRPIGQPLSLPVAPDPNFQFRKTKIFTLGAQIPKGLLRAKAATNLSSNTTSSTGKSTTPSAVVQEQSLLFERSYRLYGAVTGFDQRQHYGDYFDFFWRSKQPANVIVRFEYKQEKLRAFVQAKELTYTGAQGTCHSAFRVIGDEFANDGSVLAWRCLLIANQRIVAEKRSFLWERSG